MMKGARIPILHRKKAGRGLSGSICVKSAPLPDECSCALVGHHLLPTFLRIFQHAHSRLRVRFGIEIDPVPLHPRVNQEGDMGEGGYEDCEDWEGHLDINGRCKRTAPSRRRIHLGAWAQHARRRSSNLCWTSSTEKPSCSPNLWNLARSKRERLYCCGDR